MTVASFITLLTVFSALTSVCTEGVKKLLDNIEVKYSANVLAFVIACIIGVCGTGIYFTFAGIAFTLNNIICMILMGIASSIGAMIGYDKVIQAIKQISNNESVEE